MGGARALIRAPSDRWRFTQNFAVRHTSLAYVVFEICFFPFTSLVTAGFFIVCFVYVSLLIINIRILGLDAGLTTTLWINGSGVFELYDKRESI